MRPVTAFAEPLGQNCPPRMGVLFPPGLLMLWEHRQKPLASWGLDLCPVLAPWEPRMDLGPAGE